MRTCTAQTYAGTAGAQRDGGVDGKVRKGPDRVADQGDLAESRDEAQDRRPPEIAVCLTVREAVRFVQVVIFGGFGAQ
jgi:hypothetical protein